MTGRRIDLAEFVGEILDEISDLDDDAKEAISSLLKIATASRAGDLQNLLLEASDDS